MYTVVWFLTRPYTKGFLYQYRKPERGGGDRRYPRSVLGRLCPWYLNIILHTQKFFKISIANIIQIDTLYQMLIQKGYFAKAEFMANIKEAQVDYQRAWEPMIGVMIGK